MKNLQRKVAQILWLVLFLLYHELLAQKQVSDSSIHVPILAVSYGMQIPNGNMAERFGWNNSLGLQFLYKTKKQWVYGFGANFIFGNTVHETGLMSNITTSDGYFIGSDGHYAEVRLYERGFYASFNIGRILPFLKANKNSGFLLLVGPGFLQHMIRIEDTDHTLPALSPPYLKGYDRLSNGFAISTFMGYVYLSKNHLMNIYAGLDLVQSWTQNRRLVNFETAVHDNTKRYDCLNGFKIGWILPLYKRASTNYYYN